MHKVLNYQTTTTKKWGRGGKNFVPNLEIKLQGGRSKPLQNISSIATDNALFVTEL